MLYSQFAPSPSSIVSAGNWEATVKCSDARKWENELSQKFTSGARNDPIASSRASLSYLIV